MITSSNPVGFQNNVTFIVDLDSLGDPEICYPMILEQTKTRSKWYLSEGGRGGGYLTKPEKVTPFGRSLPI